MVHKKKNSRKKPFIIGAVVVVLLIIVGLGWYWHANRNKTGNQTGTINYGPPTDTEKQETEDHKKELEDQANSPAPTATKTVVITSLTTSEARGYVTGVVEDGGTCTLTLTKDNVKVTGSSTALGDVNKTTCGAITINPAQLTSGEWNATLNYTSSTSSGVSSSQILKVP